MQLAHADCLLATGKPQQARQLLGVLIRDHPGQARLWLFLAVAWEACGDTPRALNCARRAGELEPDNVEAQLLSAVLSERAGQTELTKRLLDETRQLAPDNLLRKEVEARLGQSASGAEAGAREG
jgi:predicted Zn-dependent protease